MAGKRFKVALSFAGEKRDFVAQVAALLAQRFGESSVLYDKFHEAEFAVYDLGIKLPRLYGEESELIVPVLCQDYDHKRWTGWEWLHIHGLLTRQDGHRVMPSRFDFAVPDGLSPASGFIELDDKTPEAFVELILKRLALNEERPTNHGLKPPAEAYAAAQRPTPNNLPRLPFFFGREDERQRIAAALAPEARGWGVLIDGPGGIGKTALAIRAAEEVPAGRFSRIVFLSAKERELTADGQRALDGFVLPTALEMMNAIARELKQDALTQAPETRRSEDLLRALREQNLLLVLDNLETLPTPDRDQLFGFLNRLPPGSSAIVTSRRRADAGAVSIRLDRLDWPATEHLLQALCDQQPALARTTLAERQALHQHTGGNPLLMRWVAGQLARGHYRDMGAALALLASPEAHNNPLEFVFGDLLDSFSHAETQVLVALTHFSLPASVAHLAELAELNTEAAAGALADLASRALVLPDVEERHYTIVPLVADFLRRRQPKAVAHTGERLVAQAYALAVENSFSQHERFPHLEAAWPTLAAALPLLQRGPNPRLQTVCDALQDFLDFSGRWDEWLALSLAAEQRAQAEGDTYNAGWRAYQAGWVHRLRQQAAGVLACADRASAHWQGTPVGRYEQATTIHLRGQGHELANNRHAALAAFQQALALWHSLDPNSANVASALNDIADLERQAGQHAEAEGHYREALRISQWVKHDEGVATYTGNLAALALDRQDWRGAEALAREALALSQAVGRLELIAKDCLRLAKALAHQGRPAEGLPFARRAVDLYERLRSPDLAAAQATLAACQAG